MAEFCLECWNKMNGTRHSKRKYVLSKDLDLCEGCGEFKHVVIMERTGYNMHNPGYICWPFEIVLCILCFIWELLKLTYVIFKNRKSKNKRS